MTQETWQKIKFMTIGVAVGVLIALATALIAVDMKLISFQTLARIFDNRTITHPISPGSI